MKALVSGSAEQHSRPSSAKLACAVASLARAARQPKRLISPFNFKGFVVEMGADRLCELLLLIIFFKLLSGNALP